MRHRVFVGMHEVAGYYTHLAIGLRARGMAVTHVGARAHVFQYASSGVPAPLLLKLHEHYAKRRSEMRGGHPAGKVFYALMHWFFKSLFFVWSVLRHDVFIFGFASSFLPGNSDLPILRLLGKRVISCVAHGSDARPVYIDGGQRRPNSESFEAPGELIKLAANMKKRIGFIERHSSFVIGAPLSCQFLNRSFINWFVMGIPFHALHEGRPRTGNSSNAVRILHSPSHPIAKGTPRIREAIRVLKSRGHAIDFVEIAGQPNSAVLQELELCDFVVDQVYSDNPMAGFATEAAFFGKPAVVGGYGWSELKSCIPLETFAPSQISHPDDLETAIEQLIVDPVYRLELGKRAYEFATIHLKATAVAERYVTLMDGNVPKSWWFEPNRVKYVRGAGLSERDTRNLVREIVEVGGTSALQLDDKPALRQAFLDFAEIKG